MIRSLRTSDERFLNTLSQINNRLAKAQQQSASGKRLLDVSDDPDQVTSLLMARASLARVQQVQTNLGRIKTETDAAEVAISNSVKIMERARVLATQGLNGTQTAESRAAIASEVNNLVQQLANASNTYVNGRFIFSGDSDQAESFIYTANPPSISTYQGAPATRLALHTAGNTFVVSKDGEEVFANADPAKNAFAALTSLAAALTANDPAAISQAISDITSSDNHLNQMLAWYGAAQNRVSEAIDTANKSEISLKAEIGQAEDADMSEVLLEMQRAAFQQEVALSSRAQLPQKSLFDYLG
jgi:flagellar hook-associated protein 3 FlgL